MQKVKVTSLVSIIGLFGMIAYSMFNNDPILDKEIFRTSISPTHTLVGYRNNNGNATTGFSYYFYIQANGTAEQPIQFLVTDTPDIHLQIKSHDELLLMVQGKVFQFTNIIWVNDQGRLSPVNIEFTAKSPAGR